LLLVLALLACQPAPVTEPEPLAEAAPRLRFEPLPAATGSLDAAVATQKAFWGDRELAIRFTPLIYTNDQPGSSPFPMGTMRDRTGQPIAINTHTPYTDRCNELDFAGILTAHGKPWLVSHVECGRGDLWLTELSQSAEGALSAVSTKPIPSDDLGGIWNPCAGQVSPWNTLLSSEEYEPDARWLRPDGSIGREKEEWGAWKQVTDAWKGGTAPSPYRFGWTPETTILDASGATKLEKHYAMGRFSHEIAYVLPDRKTVYLSDDGVNVGWFLFVADEPGNLSAGHLYAAKWTIESADGGGKGKLEWIPLGHATNAEVAAKLDAGVKFEDFFRAEDPKADGTCSEGLTLIRTVHSPYAECLALKPEVAADPAQKALAARVETRRVAALEGATVELNKGEGVTFDEVHGTVFLALSDVSKGMGDETGKIPAGMPDTVKLPRNKCGGVYGGPTEAGQKDTAGNPIASEHVMTRLDAVIVGQELEDGKACHADGIANPDNLAFVHGHGLLLVAEDTEKHAHNALWAYDVDAKSLVRVLEAPDGGEVTGIHWYPDVGGFAYISATIQHPFVDEGGDEPPVPFAEADPRRRSHQGVIGPFPAAR
jgi:secreted PhoX family phosphatase